MDKNTIIGLVLITIIFIVSSIIMQPSDEEVAERKRVQDSIEQARIEEQQRREEATRQRAEDEEQQQNIPAATDSLATDSAATQPNRLLEKYGSFAEAAQGEEEFITLENDLLRIKFSTLGGRPYTVELKNYTRYDSTALILFDGENTKFSFDFFADNRQISTADLYFQPTKPLTELDASSSEQTLRLRAKASENEYIEYVYSLQPDSFLVNFDINFVNMNGIIPANSSYLIFNWAFDAPQQEKGRQWETDNTTIYYKHYEDDVDYLSERKDQNSDDITTRLRWVAFKQQFFSSVLIADNYIESGEIKYVRDEKAEDRLMRFTADLTFPYEPGNEYNIPMTLYFGPNKYSILNDLNDVYAEDLDLQRLIPLGWGIFGWVNKWMIIPLFNFLNNHFVNIGLIILLLTFIIKALLFPLTYRSYLSSAKMRVLKPEIDKINEKIPKEKAMERQQATMGLYRRVGVNPMGGCLPMLLQFPILIAMFRFFPASIELRHKGFLWADDLSTYDSVLDLPFEIPFYGDHVSLFTLLMAVALVISTKINSGQMNTSNAQMPGMKFMMMWMMPIMLMLWFNNYSSGLSYYYFLSNVITIGQIFIFRAMIDDDKVLQKLKENKKKPKKKSKWQQRMEDLAKQQQQRTPGKPNKKPKKLK